MAEKKKRRRAYLDDFKKTESGDYAWQGAQYRLELSAEEQKRLFLRLWLLLAAAAACLIICGCVPAPGMEGSPWVLIPYVLEWIAFALGCSCLFRMTQGRGVLREYVYEAAVLNFPGRERFSEICCCVAALGEGICIFLQDASGRWGYALVFFGLEAVVWLLWRRMRMLLKGQKWTKIIK